MATNYVISRPHGPAGPFYGIVTSGGQVVALQIVTEEWAERIVTALKLLDAHERDQPVESRIEKIKKEMGKSE